MKWNRKECLSNLCYVTGTVLTDISFLCIGALAGVFLWKGYEGKEGKRLKCLHLLYCHSDQSGHPVHQSKGGDLAYVSGTVFPSSLTALLLELSPLGYFLTIYFIFALLELLPSASFGVYNAWYHSVANRTLFAGHIYAIYFSPNSFLIYKLQIIQGQCISYAEFQPIKFK